MPTYTCVIIGSGTLAARCGEMLREQGHQVLAAVVGDETMRQWALAQGLAPITPAHAAEAIGALPPFDLLLSIVSPLIVPPALLRLPRRAAINYHDGPLPRYAGTHATTWALINREPSHGVTWHIMTEQLDAGAILVQEIFPLAASETAVSLNARCYTAALSSFAALLDGLASDTLVATPQDLTARSYFPIARRPAAAATIRWSQTAAELEAMVRALQFGSYPNYLCLTKLMIGAHAYLVEAADVVDAPTNEPAGTILELSDRRLLVATGEGMLAIRRIITADGLPITLSAALYQAGLQVGMRLPELTPADVAAISALHRALARHEMFWLRRLSSLNPLPAPYPLRPGAGPAQVLRAEIAPDLVRFVRGHTPEAPRLALMAACAAFLGRLSSRDHFDIGIRDLALGTSTPWPQLFASTLPLGFSTVANSTFAALLDQLLTARDSLILHETYLRDLTSRHPELRAQTSHLPIEFTQASAPGPQDEGQQSAELVVGISDDADTIIWQSASCEEGSLERLHRAFLAFLSSLAAQPELPIGQHALLDMAEQRLLAAWNQTARPYPQADLASLFEQQASRRPTAPALRYGDEELSYAQLDQRANQLAHALQARGVGPEQLVAICVERSIEMVVAILGVLKAGGAYLPLDPSHPLERLAFMVRDSGAALVLTQQQLRARLATLAPSDAWLSLDADWPMVAQLPASAPPRSVTADQLAYVIYTSGSTGLPKGVMVTQRGIGNLAQAQIAAFAMDEDSRELQFASFGFDASVSEIATALIAGATLYLAPQEQLMPGLDLTRLLQSAAISVVTLPPSVLALLEPNDFPQLRTVVSAGEACPPEIVTRWAPGRRFINAYGPTETTVCATMAVCQPDGQRPTIGQPIANMAIHMLDAQLQPLPIGIPGELCISGVGLARGYLHRPELSAERFVYATHSATPDTRLYRTGDLARWLASGEIEYLGRIDQQVKLRGYRIEPGEIESLLLRQPLVKQALVMVREDVPGDPRLVAYVATGEQAESASDLSGRLRTSLQSQLPTYMLPSAIIVLPSLPLTRNGKIDIKALPATNALGNAVRDLPRTPTEAQIAAIWTEVLHIDGVGIFDHFFELGGHSLLATQVVSRIRELFQIELTLTVLMGVEPTVAATASAVEAFLIRQADPAEIAALLAELELLSDDEVRALLA
jgi:amino acid adenylation domain-containing protein